MRIAATSFKNSRVTLRSVQVFPHGMRQFARDILFRAVDELPVSLCHVEPDQHTDLITLTA